MKEILNLCGVFLVVGCCQCQQFDKAEEQDPASDPVWNDSRPVDEELPTARIQFTSMQPMRIS